MNDSTAERLVVEPPCGPVVGLSRQGAISFRSIPFCEPPVGDLRFRPPQPMEPWREVLDCTRPGPVAPQNVWELEKLLGSADFPQDEDCLTLNIWTPAVEGSRPVMVWVHGGGFTTGSGRTPWYDGTRLAASRDVVVVTLNYRLGALGFCYLAELGGQRFRTSGINGILDQVRALEWVQENIAAFGGDPRNVTVFGESAGAMSVGTLLGMPAAKGLFRRAILQSGACSHTILPTKANAVASELLGELSIETTSVDEILSVPVPALLAAQKAVTDRRGAYLSFQPVVDGDILPRSPLESVTDGSAVGIDIIVGTNQEEMKLFGIDDPALREVDEPRMLAMMTSLGGHIFDQERARAMIDAYRSQFPDMSLGDLWFQMLTDYTFRMPAVRLAEAQSRHARVHYYLFSWASPAFGGLIGSSHSLEIPFVFDNLDKPAVDLFTGGAEAPGREALAAKMSGAWTSFARDSSPTDPGLPDWPPYDLASRATMVFDVECRLESDHEPQIRALWDGVDFHFA